MSDLVTRLSQLDIESIDIDSMSEQTELSLEQLMANSQEVGAKDHIYGLITDGPTCDCCDCTICHCTEPPR